MTTDELCAKIAAMSEEEIAALMAETSKEPIDPFVAGCAAFFCGNDPYEAEAKARNQQPTDSPPATLPLPKGNT